MEQRDSKAEFAASPAEFVDDRPQRQSNGKARAAADEQHEESGRENEPRARVEQLARQGN
jgi:hypothetical protein